MNRQQRRAAERAATKRSWRESNETEDERFRRQVLTYLGIQSECDAMSLFTSRRTWPDKADVSEEATARWFDIVDVILQEMERASSDVVCTALEFELETTVMTALSGVPTTEVATRRKDVITDRLYAAAKDGVLNPAIFSRSPAP